MDSHAGDYDSTYEAMAQAIAAWPNTLLSARVGWEFNGNWYAWSNGVRTYARDGATNYVLAFQHAAKRPFASITAGARHPAG